MCFCLFPLVQVGEKATRTVAVTNRSPVPLFYSISKSRSINSGFLKIPEVQLCILLDFVCIYFLSPYVCCVED